MSGSESEPSLSLQLKEAREQLAAAKVKSDAVEKERDEAVASKEEGQRELIQVKLDTTNAESLLRKEIEHAKLETAAVVNRFKEEAQKGATSFATATDLASGVMDAAADVTDFFTGGQSPMQMKQNQRMKLRPSIPQFHSASPKTGDNNWNNGYEDTVRSWLETCDRTSFIYDQLGDNARDRVEHIAVIMLIITSATSIVSYLQLNTDAVTDPDASKAYKYVLTVLTSLSAFFVSYQLIKKYAQTIKNNSKYVQQLLSFQSILLSEVTLPKKLRQDAEQFIVTHKDTYKDLLLNAPEINQKDYQREYKNYLSCQNEDMNSKMMTSQLYDKKGHGPGHDIAVAVGDEKEEADL